MMVGDEIVPFAVRGCINESCLCHQKPVEGEICKFIMNQRRVLESVVSDVCLNKIPCSVHDVPAQPTDGTRDMGEVLDEQEAKPTESWGEEFDREFTHLDYCLIRSLKRECSCYQERVKSFITEKLTQVYLAGQDRERERVVALRSKIEGLGKRKKDVDSENDLIYGGIYNQALSDVLKLLE